MLLEWLANQDLPYEETLSHMAKSEFKLQWHLKNSTSHSHHCQTIVWHIEQTMKSISNTKVLKPSLLLSIALHVGILLISFPVVKRELKVNHPMQFSSTRIVIKSILAFSEREAKKTYKKKAPLAPSLKTAKKVRPIKKYIKKNSGSEILNFEKSIIKNSPPVYPRIARKRGFQGEVEVLISISAKGVVKAVEVLRASAHESLVKSAIDAASKWLFTPSPYGNSYKVKKLLIYKLK
jgi:TonB family protein